MNRLAEETSPYLRQHADNPVEWHPWGPEAFAEAKTRDVPVLLSIGYSACHWCHVMAHESFENPDVAGQMNTGFVCIKVDREERPDVDAVYMESVQAVTGSGGWPMTVFLLADGRPFHGGTYFPRRPFSELLDQISAIWRDRRAEIEEAAAKLSEAVRAGTSRPSRAWAAGATPRDDTGVGPELLEVAAGALLSRFDPEWGGFGRAPKFPQPPMLEMLLLAAWRTNRTDLLGAVTATLDAMASGGIYDHLGGGFARYSTDRQWLVPHFEKMLYDNALLSRIYLHAWQLTGAARYRQVVDETIGYLLRAPMRIAGAGFASAEDADSEGVEGRFYVWSYDELTEVGGAEAATWYGASPNGNWEATNILHRPVRGDLERPKQIETARAALFERREHRVRPGLDDKVLTEWNAMAVAALAEAGAALDRPEWVAEAEKIAHFMVAELRGPEGRWMRSWQAGRARHLAYGADYAWLVEAFTRLAEASGAAEWVREAVAAADGLIDLFWDPGDAIFATTGRDAESLFARTVDTQDGALPSTNSVATAALTRLAALTGEQRYRDRAQMVVDAMAPALNAAPVAFTGLVAAANLVEGGPTEIAVTGNRPDLLVVLRRRYLPDAVVAWGEPFPSPLWEGRLGAELSNLAFVCRNYTCRSPVGDPDSLEAQLGDPPIGARE